MWADGGVYVVLAAECGWWLDTARTGRKFFLTSCAPESAGAATPGQPGPKSTHWHSGEGPHLLSGPGQHFPPKLCFMSRVRCSSHSLTFMFIQTHEAELGWETEAEQLGLKKDLTFSFHPISQQSWSRLSSICINNLPNRAHIHNFNVYFFISVQCFLACCDLFIIQSMK